jgi:putative intracellular protease/amidase
MNSYKWALSIVLLGALILSACQPVMPVEPADEAVNEVRKVLLIPREGSFDAEYMVTHEVGVVRSMLEEAGFEVVVATETGLPVTSWGKPLLESDMKLEEVDVSEYVGVVLACMAAGLPGYIPKEAVEIVKEAVAAGKPVAAQYGAVAILGASGVLEGKEFAYEDDAIQGALY